MSSSSSFKQRIKDASTAAESSMIQRDLNKLLQRNDEKKKKLEAKETKDAIGYKGREAFKCYCGNQVDPKQKQKFLSSCVECDHKACVECFSDCGVCDKSNLCTGGDDDNEPCLQLCTSCEDCLFCTDCRLKAEICHNCEEPMCPDCPQQHGPFFYCADCFDHVNGW
mmetsp:Transcript_18328/g.27694  ORF Transcript_18328/g.27694 Transcript_18328/m.27694 type:complete len:167 (-) Transcript_18328:73-573(-)